MTITLPGERAMSWNKLYSGSHWSLRYSEAERVHELIRDKVKNFKILEAPVDITITAYFRIRPLDADNVMSKYYVDGLKGLVIRDDTPEYVSSVTTKSRRDLLRPRVEIEVEYASAGGAS
jgi:hypothetical protein